MTVTLERKSKPDDMLEMGLVERTKSTRMAMRLQSGWESNQEGNLSRQDGGELTMLKMDQSSKMRTLTGVCDWS